MVNLARFSYSKIVNKFNCKQSFPDVTQCWKYPTLPFTDSFKTATPLRYSHQLSTLWW